MNDTLNAGHVSIFRKVTRIFALVLLLLFCWAVFQRIYLAVQFQKYVPTGSAIPLIQEKMSPKGFVCSRTSEKLGTDEVSCLKKERIGPGLTNDFSRFVVAILPNAVYWLLPKDAGGSATYRQEEVTFVLDGGSVASVHAEIRLTPQ